MKQLIKILILIFQNKQNRGNGDYCNSSTYIREKISLSLWNKTGAAFTYSYELAIIM